MFGLQKPKLVMMLNGQKLNLILLGEKRGKPSFTAISAKTNG